MIKDRDLIRKNEHLQHPIFLLQVKRFIPFHDAVDNSDYQYDSDLEGIYHESEIEKSREDEDYSPTPATWEELIENELATLYWDTISVFLTREEGKEFIKDTYYRYPGGESGARIYSVPASIMLGDFLDNHWSTEQKRLEGEPCQSLQ